MKRILIVLIALVAVFALVLPASAADFKFGGMFWTKFYSTNNIRDGSDGTKIYDPETNEVINVPLDDNVNGFYTRMRMYFTAIASENLKAVSKVEVDSIWGDGRIGSVSVDGGSDGRADAGNPSANSGWEIKNAYIDFNIPDTALNFKAGLVGAKLGKSGIVFADDTPAIIAGYTYDPMSFTLMYSRLNDNATGIGEANTAATANNAADDWDLWGFDFTYSQEAWSANLDIGYIRSGSVAGADPSHKSFDLWIIGLDGDYKADVWSAYLTFAINFGTNETTYSLDPDGVARPGEEDFKGWMVTAGGDFNLSDMITLGGDFYWATGDDNPNDDDNDTFTTPGIIGRPSYYMDDIVFPGWFDDESSTVATFPGGGAFLNNATSTGMTRSNAGYTMTNIWAIGLHADIKPLEQTLIQPGVAYMQFVEDVYSQLDDLTDPLKKDSDLGFSAYVRLNQGITDGLVLKATFGYLFAGDAYSVVSDEDNAYKFATGLFWSW